MLKRIYYIISSNTVRRIEKSFVDGAPRRTESFRRLMAGGAGALWAELRGGRLRQRQGALQPGGGADGAEELEMRG